jgi:hypothetical protein
MTTPGEVGLEKWRGTRSVMDGTDPLVSFLPNKVDASIEWTNLLRETRKVWGVKNADSQLPQFDAELTTEELARRRYHKALVANDTWSSLGQRWGVAFTLYEELIHVKKKQWIRFLLLDRLGILKIYDPDKLFEVLKELGRIAKKHGEFFPEDMDDKSDWKFIVNLETFGSYAPVIDESLFLKEVIEWVTGNKDKKSLSMDGQNWDTKSYEKQFEKYCVAILSELPNKENADKSKDMTIKEWSRAPANWANSGATSDRTKLWYVDKDGSRRVVAKNKWRSALAMSPEKVESIIRGKIPRISLNKVLQKRETGKVRAVVSSNLETYLVQSYAGSWIEEALKGNTNSSLWYNSTMQVEMYNNMALSMGGQVIHTPADVSSYDKDVSTFENVSVEKCVGVINDRYAPKRIRSDLRVASKTLSLLTERRFVRVDNKNIKVESGLLSGERWTAKKGSVTSSARLRIVNELLNRIVFQKLIYRIAQGDDTEWQTRMPGASSAGVRILQLMNIPINVQKSFIASKRTEYLRQVPQPKHVSGYPARTISGLLWRNPVSRDPPAGIGRMEEQLGQWNLFYSRGGEWSRVYKHMVRDLSRANGVRKELVERILRTPKTLGGLGFLPTDGGTLVSYTPGSIEVAQTLIDEGVNGIADELEDWKQWGMIIPREAAIRTASNFLDLPDAKRVITRGKVSLAQYELPLGLSESPGPGPPLQAYMNVKLPKTFGQLALEIAIKDKRWDWIRNTWLGDNLGIVSDRIQSRGGRGLWLDWLRGKLPWATPKVPGSSDLSVSVIYNRFARHVWGSTLRRWKFNRTLVKRAAMTAEIHTYNVVRSQPVRLGG